MIPQHFEDDENFSAPDDSPSCSQIHKYSSLHHNHPNDKFITRLNSMKNMDFATLVKPSPFQQTPKSLSSAENSPDGSKFAKSLINSQYSSGLSTTAGPAFFGSSLNLPSLLQKDEVDPLAENDLKENSKHSGIIKMGEKSKYSKGYPSWASVGLLPDMTSYNTCEDDSHSEDEEVMYPDKYVIEVSEDDEESQDDYESQQHIRFSSAQYTRKDFKVNGGR